MSTQLTLEIPDHVYEQAQRLAEANDRPLADILAEALLEAFPRVHVHPQQAAMLEEEAAFEAMRTALLARYEGEFVAVKSGQVVDHDGDQTALVERISGRYPDQIVLIRQVNAAPEKVLSFRSPRL